MIYIDEILILQTAYEDKKKPMYITFYLLANNCRMQESFYLTNYTKYTILVYYKLAYFTVG